MTDDEITAPEAVEALVESGVEVTLDELRTLARERRISARKVAGVWQVNPSVVAPQILEEQARSDEGADDGTDEDRIEEAIEAGKEQARQDNERSPDSINDRVFNE